jgi:hypothetical protein
MKKMKRTYSVLVSLFIIFGIVIYLVYLWVTPPQSLDSRLAEEQAIYSIIISREDLLAEKTEPGGFDANEYRDYVEKRLPELREETWNDYQEVNTQSYSFKNYLSVNMPFTFLSGVEIEQIYQKGWEAYKDKYPNSYRITSFSRIGFDSRFSQALVLKVYSAPTEEGGYSEGTFLLFQKKHGVWTLVQELMAWIT